MFAKLLHVAYSQRLSILVGWTLLAFLLVATSSVATGSMQSPVLHASLEQQQATKPSKAANSAIEFINQSFGVPVESLSILSDFEGDYSSIGRKIQIVTAVDTRPNGEVYKLGVDLDTLEVETDLSSLQLEEEIARQAPYGKLDATLYDVLEDASETDLIPVVIWTKAQKDKSLSELQDNIYRELAVKYGIPFDPDTTANPTDIQDPDLSKQIYNEYVSTIIDVMAERTSPVASYLRDKGIPVIAYEGAPFLSASLTKADILALAQREDIGAVTFSDANPRPAMESAHKTVRSGKVHGRGIDGNGVKIAIIEYGNVSPTNHSINLANDFRSGGLGPSDHPTRVAFVAGSLDPVLVGVAMRATLYSAGYDGTEADYAGALNWAFDSSSPRNADVASLSEQWYEDTQLHTSDRIVDYFARYKLRFISVAAGNKYANFNVTTPGKAWNVLTVGGIADQNNKNWNDDQMFVGSRWVNPNNGGANDHEKPEVVAVGESVTTLGENGAVDTLSGTSFASPAVAGIGALLVKRGQVNSNNIVNLPEAIRAIIIATALNNIDGYTDLTGSDLKDGAGSVVAINADDVAQRRSFNMTGPCSQTPQPCWWWAGWNNSNFPVGTYKYLQFKANAGKRIRVAIAWNSNSDCSSGSPLCTDRLDTDFDLCVLDPNNSTVGGGTVDGDGEDETAGTASGSCSNHVLNNYELVDFKAPLTGIYKIRIKKYSANESSNSVGVAVWLKP